MSALTESAFTFCGDEYAANTSQGRTAAFGVAIDHAESGQFVGEFERADSEPIVVMERKSGSNFLVIQRAPSLSDFYMVYFVNADGQPFAGNMVKPLLVNEGELYDLLGWL